MNTHPAISVIFNSTEPQLVLLRGRVHLLCSNIVRLEADRNYTRFILADGRQILTSKSLSFYAPQLPTLFFRVNKSYFLNPVYIINLNKYTAKMQDGFVAQVARRRRSKIK